MADPFRAFGQNYLRSALSVADGGNKCRAIVDNFPACGKHRAECQFNCLAVGY